MFRPEFDLQAGEEGDGMDPVAAQNPTTPFFAAGEWPETDVQLLVNEQHKSRAFAAIREKLIASQRQKIEKQEKQIKYLEDVVAQQKSCLSQMEEKTKVQQKWRETMAEPGTAGYYKILHEKTKSVVARMSEIMIDQSKAIGKCLEKDQEFWQAHAEFFEKLLV